MEGNIIGESIIFKDCYTGTDFENKTLDFLRLAGLKAERTGGANDGGIDIVASVNIQGAEYSYFIQCKYYNKPLGKHPIQEAYTGAAFYNNIGKPVVITNNEVTFTSSRTSPHIRRHRPRRPPRRNPQSRRSPPPRRNRSRSPAQTQMSPPPSCPCWRAPTSPRTRFGTSSPRRATSPRIPPGP